jgi:hypothetical protein
MSAANSPTPAPDHDRRRCDRLRRVAVARDTLCGLLKRAAAAGEGPALAAVVEAADVFCSGDAERESKRPTFEELARMWTSGELARKYPDHVKVKRSADDDGYRLEKHLYPLCRRYGDRRLHPGRRRA